MGQINVIHTPIEGLYIIEPTIHGDSRGYFMESYSQRDMDEAGIHHTFVQDNQLFSKKGVLRGLHFQRKNPQGKLVHVIQGKVFDVAVDVRAGSQTYGRWFGVELSGDNSKQFYIGEGFAHGFLVMSEVAILCYKVTNYWYPDDEIGIPWDDSDIGIKWPLENGQRPIIAEKDKHYARFLTLMEGVSH